MSTLLSLAYPVSTLSLERSCRARRSHPNPLGLTGSRNGPRQSHFSYLKLFHDLSLAKGAYFSKKIVACLRAVPATPVETEDRHAMPSDRHRTPLRNNCTKPVNPLGLTVVVPGEGQKRKNHPHPQSQNVDWNQQLKSENGATSNARKTSFVVEMCVWVNKVDS